MEEFTHKEKIATLRLVSEIMYADQRIDEQEVKYFWELTKSFGLDESCKAEVDNLQTEEALSAVSCMSEEQKGFVAQMMGRMIVVDRDINYNEVVLYNSYCKGLNIDKEFDADDFPF